MKKFKFYVITFLFIIFIFQGFSFLIITKLEDHRFIKHIITKQQNSNKNKLLKKYRDILPYIRNHEKFTTKNNYSISYNENELLFSTLNKFDNAKSENILIQGDSWAEIASKSSIFNYLKSEAKIHNFGLINSGISSYSPSPMTVQLFILNRDFNINPSILVAIIDQTDLGDEIYRYNNPDWSQNKINYFDQSHEKKLIKIFTSKRLSIIKLYDISKLYYVSKYNKLEKNNINTIKYVLNRFKDFLQDTPAVLSPLKNGLSDNDESTFTKRLNIYIEIAFKNKNLKKIIFVTHPHRKHLLKKNRYKSDVGSVLDRIINKSSFKNRIEHVNFLKDEINIINKLDINKLFLKDDVYSHLTEEAYLNYYYPKIIKKILDISR
jgi:hypothetical protein